MKTISNTFTVNTVIDGDDAAIAFATPSQISIPCYYTGYVKAQKVTSVTFSLKVGTNAATVTSVTSGTKPTGVAVTGVAANAVTITVGTSATASGLSTGVTFTVTGTYGGKTYSATVTVALIGSTQGEQGERGKVGRFFYFGGTFNAADTTQTFIVNDAQAPYFEHSETVTTKSGTTTIKRYHVFNYDTNGTYTMAQMWAIRNNWNYKPWESMTNDFKYIITEALFGSFAHLGSFIINGHWMISQHGTINGQESVNYTQFDPDHPNDNTGTNFIPNFCVDGLTGVTYQQNAHIKGTIQAQIFYHNITKPDFHSHLRAATLSDDCGDVVISRVPWTQQNSWVELTLPHAAAQEGRILTAYSGTLFQVTSGYAYTKIFAQEAAGIFRYDDGYSVTSAINVDVGDSAEFYSDGTQWYLLCIRKHAT